MRLDVPDHLYELFITFMDLSQAMFTDEDITRILTVQEKELFAWMQKVIGKDRLTRFKTSETLRAAKDAFKATVKTCEKENGA